MAPRPNKFKDKYNSRNKTSTDDIVEQLYENAVESTQAEEQSVEEVVPQPVEQPEPVPQTIIAPEPVNTVVTTVVKKKVGRPRKTLEERTIFNIKLTAEEKQMLEVASSASGKNKLDYLVNLLKKDYQENFDYYETVKSKIYAED
ncbi:hypothetical protein [Butyrivibrio sp. AC2005]|uniref:hypothetical protein n=1 Tax=Butyrivibrio sp. AC2005 TaxID=1280672 RepID=UPI00042784DA|nr:hypothetical protein [Butyrivibrio sp. AC2005]